MIELTQSLRHFLFTRYPKELPLVMFGHMEYVDDHWDEYIEWCETEEGRSYLKGGSNYREVDE